MNEPSTTIDVPPDVARISEGLRDTGYNFNTAIADIVDNSIAAQASRVEIRVGADFGGRMFVSVADNGAGMDREGLVNAMMYGSKRRPNSKSLGKFGLGLKTASTAFCRRLSVISRQSVDAPLRASWDLDAMAASNSWGLEVGPLDATHIELLNSAAQQGSGTLVMWESIDRLLEGHKDKSARKFKNAVDRLESSLRDHLGLIYQRFIDSKDTREKDVQILLNGTPVISWDPFCLDATKSPVSEQKVPVELQNGEKSSFTIRAFILPRKEEFENEEARVAAKVSNERQGFYVYRENRLIHGPDWMGMYSKEPHFSLLRIELSFSHDLDDAFQVDIKKSRILLNESLYEWLRDKFLAGLRREAEVRYRRGAASVATGAATLLHTPSSNVIHQKAGSLSTASVAVVDGQTGEVQVTNKAGGVRAVIRIVDPADSGPIHISTAEALEHGVLWEPMLGKGGAPAVALNAGHPFYVKAYLPNKANTSVVQALDYLLWALANAELNNIDETSREAFEEFRVEVSRNLKKLVADLPGPTEATSN